MEKISSNLAMRVAHRYLGFFLVGIMAMYAVSGIILIFRDTDFLKKDKSVEKKIKTQVQTAKLGEALGIKKIKIKSEDNNYIYFENGNYNKQTGQASYTIKTLPFVLDKMTHLHKAKSSEPLFFLNIFFGLSLLFFVISSFWMYRPKTSIFRKGLYFVIAGIVLTLVLIFV
ncbi:MAG: hypothetical protein SFU27_02700 [Thermonemataceae bacterium]|nr:hypothetical protein [Thermonemataceae bacterium]